MGQGYVGPVGLRPETNRLRIRSCGVGKWVLVDQVGGSLGAPDSVVEGQSGIAIQTGKVLHRWEVVKE